MLDAVLDPDPLALEAHAPLLVRMRVHWRHRVRLERHDRQHGVDAGEDPCRDAGRELSDDAALAEVMEHTISFRVRLQARPEPRSEEHTSELQSHSDLVCRLLLEKKKQATSE